MAENRQKTDLKAEYSNKKLQWRTQIIFSSCNPSRIKVLTQLIPTVVFLRNFIVENKAKMGKNGQNDPKKGYPANFEAQYLEK